MAVGKGEEDAPHSGCLGFVDATLAVLASAVAGIGLDHVVAEGLAAGLLALERTAELAAPGLLAEIREEKLRHVAEHADMHTSDLTGCDGVELDAGEAETIERFDHHDIEEAA